jgi:hypothetical protein
MALLPTQVSAHDHTSSPPHVKVINTEVLAPFSLDASHDRRILVADGFTSKISQVTKDGLKTVLTAEGVSGLARSRDGRTIAYTTLAQDGTTTLGVKGPHGKWSVNLSDYEKMHNPDKVNIYGVHLGVSTCVTDYLKMNPDIPAPRYHGVVDSHPYAVTALRHGAWAVAEAAGNDILKVTKTGHVSTLAVLPPQSHKFTAAEVAGMGAPDCLIGVTFRFEPVPTDVEVGPHGMLYVTTLPGGPEGPALGARGSVYRVNPWTGATHRIATGFSGATNLAICPDCRIYVAELFGGKVSVIHHGKVWKYVSIDSPVSIESRGHTLYVGTLAKIGPKGPEGTGSIVKITQDDD